MAIRSQGADARCEARICLIGRSDYEAVISGGQAPRCLAQPLFLLGHSLGAQLPGLLKKPEQVDGPAQRGCRQRLLA